MTVHDALSLMLECVMATISLISLIVAIISLTSKKK
ncbi:putative holin-like toxin [Gottfriedia solisilvae]